MSYAIVYSSRTGNTAMLARAVREALPQEDCRYFGAPAPQALAADTVYVGFWTDKGTCDEPTARFLQSLTDQKVFLFGTAGFGGAPAYFQQILDRLEGAQRDRFSQLFTRFGRAVEEIRYYNGRALSFANEGLRILGGVAPGAQPGTYDAAGKRPGQGGASPLFDAEV